MPYDRSKDLTTGEAAKKLGLSVRTVAKFCDQGLLACWRIPAGASARHGGHRRIRSADLLSFAVAHGIWPEREPAPKAPVPYYPAVAQVPRHQTYLDFLPLGPEPPSDQHPALPLCQGRNHPAASGHLESRYGLRGHRRRRGRRHPVQHGLLREVDDLPF